MSPISEITGQCNDRELNVVVIVVVVVVVVVDQVVAVVM